MSCGGLCFLWCYVLVSIYAKYVIGHWTPLEMYICCRVLVAHSWMVASKFLMRLPVVPVLAMS